MVAYGGTDQFGALRRKPGALLNPTGALTPAAPQFGLPSGPEPFNPPNTAPSGVLGPTGEPARPIGLPQPQRGDIPQPTGMTGGGAKAPPPVGSTPPPPVGQGTFTADRNLIGSQIAGPQTPEYGRIGAGTLQYDPLTDRARTLTGQSLEAVAGGPSRADIASQTLGRFEDQLGEARRLGTRQIGQDAARLGRLGSGMVTTDLGNLEERLGIAREREKGRLAGEVAGQELSDRFGRLGAVSGVAGRLRGEDLDTFGAQRSLRDEARGERAYGDQYGRLAREELRGERGYQYGLSQDAQNQALRQRMAEEDLYNSAWGRDMDINRLLADQADGGVSPLQLALAGQYGAQGQATSGGIGELLRLIAQQSGRNRPADQLSGI